MGIVVIRLRSFWWITSDKIVFKNIGANNCFKCPATVKWPRGRTWLRFCEGYSTRCQLNLMFELCHDISISPFWNDFLNCVGESVFFNSNLPTGVKSTENVRIYWWSVFVNFRRVGSFMWNLPSSFCKKMLPPLLSSLHWHIYLLLSYE